MARRLVFRVHALRRMFERGISIMDIELLLRSADPTEGEESTLSAAVLNRAMLLMLKGPAEVIESYPDDKPYPSRLLLGWVEGRPIHVVMADNAEDNEWIIITAYEPDTALWEADFKRRKP